MSRFNFLYQGKLSHRAIAVYLYLANMVNMKNECWPAIPTMARDLRLSQSTVRRALHDLRKEGLIETTQQYRTSGGCSSLRFKLTEQK